MTKKQTILDSDIWRGLAMSYNKLNRLTGDTIEIKQVPDEGEDIPVRYPDHEHSLDCIEMDTVDMGDDGDGYVAYDIYQCRVTGEWHKRLSEFGSGE